MNKQPENELQCVSRLEQGQFVAKFCVFEIYLFIF